MNKKLVFLLLLLLSACLPGFAQRNKFYDYKDVDITSLRLVPEDFRNKKVCITATLNEFLAVIPSKLEGAVRADRFISLSIEEIPDKESGKFFVVSRKTDEIISLLSRAELPVPVMLYAIVRRVPSSGRGKERIRSNDYYLEVNHIEPVKNVPDKKESSREDWEEKDSGWDEEEKENPDASSGEEDSRGKERTPSSSKQRKGSAPAAAAKTSAQTSPQGTAESAPFGSDTPARAEASGKEAAQPGKPSSSPSSEEEDKNAGETKQDSLDSGKKSKTILKWI